MFFSSEKIEKLEREIKELRVENSQLNQTISTLNNQKSSLEHENSSLQKNIQNLNSTITTQKSKNIEIENNNTDIEVLEELEELFCYENDHLKTGLTDIQNELAESTATAKDSIKRVEDLTDLQNDTKNHLTNMVSEIDGLSKSSVSVSQIIGNLDSNAKEITKAVGMINEIVLQINILSLNASVEAASAGEAGKGFAVVAQEVKNLATKTSEAATYIENIVKSVQKSVASTNARFDTMSKNIEQITSITDTFNIDINGMFDVTAETFSDISFMTDRVFMSLAKLDHVIWKVNTYLSVAQKSEAFNFVDHKNCRLGKWYSSGDGKEFFSSTPSFKKLDRPHSLVHNGTHKVFEDIHSDDFNYRDVLQHFKEMEAASAEVFKILDRILKER